MPGDNMVVVFGGTGFIGRALVSRLVKGRYQVQVVSRHADKIDTTEPGITYFQGNVTDIESVMRAVEGASVVFHLASGKGTTWADIETEIVQGTHNVATSCTRRGVKKLIYTSSIAALYLGERRTVDENLDVDPKPERRSYYSRAKIAAEQLLRKLHRREGLPVVIVRGGLVVGTGGILNHSGIGYWASDLCCLGWGRGKTPLPFVLVQDVASALFLAMITPGIEGMALNLVGDVRPSAEEFVRIVAERSRRNFRFYPQSLVKLQVVEIAKWILKRAAKKPENPFPNFRDLKSRSLQSEFDCSAAKRILGWKPNDQLEAFVREAIDPHIKAILPGDLRLLPNSPTIYAS